MAYPDSPPNLPTDAVNNRLGKTGLPEPGNDDDTVGYHAGLHNDANSQINAIGAGLLEHEAVVTGLEAALDARATDAELDAEIAARAAGDATVTNIQAKPVPVPVAADDGKTWEYDHASGAMVWTDHPPLSYTHRELVPDVISMYPDWAQHAVNANVGAANNLLGYVVRAKKTGRLKDCGLFVGASSGNICYSVYTVAVGTGTRTLLATTGSIACPAAGMQKIFDPDLPVTEGQLICLALSCDNTTATFGRYSTIQAIQHADISADYMPEGSIRKSVVRSNSFPPSTPASWAAPAATTLPIVLFARNV